MAGFGGGPTVAPYAAAKAAVNSLMESYYLSLKPYGIGVSCLCPGGINSKIHEATFNRPGHLKSTGYLVNERTIEFEGKFNARGIDPVELAHILKRGIENEVLYIVPAPDPEAMLRDHVERVVNYATPEGMKRQDELAQKRREEMRKRMGGTDLFAGAAEAGWGKAREDLTWVKERREP